MLLPDRNPDVERTESCCILIPFHHREDLLIPLLKHLRPFTVVVVDDGVKKSDWNAWKDIHPHLDCVRTKGSSGFTRAVNSGLQRVETLGFRYVLILNDDAWLSVESIEKLFQKARPKRFVSPVIESNGMQYYGVRVHSWGLVKMNHFPFQKIDALIGACLVMPSRLRFDSRFHHGFEDLHLTMSSKKLGYELYLMRETVCTHLGGASLDSQSISGIRFSVYGHFCLFDSLKKGPIIWSIYLVQTILKDETILFRMAYLKAIHQGVFDWFWSAIAARIASSKAGSRSIK